MSQSANLTTRVLRWCVQMRAAGDTDIADLLQAAEIAKRKKPRAPQAKRVTIARHGTRVRGGQGFANLNNPDVTIEELPR